MAEIDFRADDALDLETPRKLELIDPVSDEPILIDGAPAYLMLYSAKSEIFQRRAFKVQGRLRAKVRKGAKNDLSYDEQRDAEAQIYAAAFADEWRIGRKKGGAWTLIDAPCTPENAAKWIVANPLYKPQITALTDDLDAFLGGEQADFTTEASSGSPKASKAR